MPRPVSWLPRLHEIRRSIASSVRSHYGRRDLEQLFELQPRAAQKLIEMLPTVRIGTSLLVEREALAVFLDRVREAEDVGAFLNQVRAEKAGSSRKKVRVLVARDTEPVTLSSLPESIALSRGRLEVSFATVEQLAEAMFALAQVLTTDVDAFAQAYEPEISPEVPEDAGEMEALYAELEAMEKERATAPKLTTLKSVPCSVAPEGLKPSRNRRSIRHRRRYRLPIPVEVKALNH